MHVGMGVGVGVAVACVILMGSFFSACALEMFHYNHMIQGACVVHVYMKSEKRGVCVVLSVTVFISFTQWGLG